MPANKKPAQRRYTSDNLIYEAFYVALRNSLIVAVVPMAIFILLSAIENYSMTGIVLESVTTLVEVIFILSFFINFLYYVYFIRFKRIYALTLTLVVSCALAFMIFFSNYQTLIRHEHEALVFGCWFLLVAIILVVNKAGFKTEFEEDSRYDEESWLYKHELADGKHDEIELEIDPEEKYSHKYIDTDIYASDAYDDDEESDTATRRNKK